MTVAERLPSGVPNGYRKPHDLLTIAAPVEMTVARVNDKRVYPQTVERQGFSSSILLPC
jgi:hypothetical protein